MSVPKPARRRRSGAAKAGPLPETLKARLAEALPGLFDAALEAYRRLAETDHETDPKASAAAHGAAKAALVHLELLLKLAELITPVETGVDGRFPTRTADANDFGRDRLIAAARLALRASDFDDDGSDDPDDPERG